MKKIVLFVYLLIVGSVFAQSPQAFKYQAVARDVAGDVLSNQNVSFRISILEGSETGSIVFTEIHSVTTNDYGMVSLEIGNGTLVSGDFSIINWGNNSYFLNIELDEAGGSNYQQMGVSQMLSVPYALFADATEDDGDWTIIGDDMHSSVMGNVGVGKSNPEIPLDVFGYNETMINGMIARFDSDDTDYSRIVVDGASGADAQLSFMNNGSSKWSLGNDVSSDDAFILRKGYGAFGANDVFVIPQNGQADLNLPLMGNLGGGNCR